MKMEMQIEMEMEMRKIPSWPTPATRPKDTMAGHNADRLLRLVGCRYCVGVPQLHDTTIINNARQNNQIIWRGGQAKYNNQLVLGIYWIKTGGVGLKTRPTRCRGRCVKLGKCLCNEKRKEGFRMVVRAETWGLYSRKAISSN